MSFTIFKTKPAYKRKPIEEKKESKVDKVIEEKASVATKAAIKEAKNTAKDILKKVPKEAIIGVAAGVIAIFTICANGKKIKQASNNTFYIYGGHNSFTVA